MLTHPGVYCLRSSETTGDAETLWHTHTMLTDLEAATSPGGTGSPSAPGPWARLSAIGRSHRRAIGQCQLCGSSTERSAASGFLGSRRTHCANGRGPDFRATHKASGDARGSGSRGFRPSAVRTDRRLRFPRRRSSNPHRSPAPPAQGGGANRPDAMTRPECHARRGHLAWGNLPQSGVSRQHSPWLVLPGARQRGTPSPPVHSFLEIAASLRSSQRQRRAGPA